MSRFRLTLIGFLFLVPATIGIAQLEQSQTVNSRVDYFRSLSDAERKDYEDVKAGWDKDQRTDPKKFTRLQAKFVVQAQVILGRFGYGTKFTGALDLQTQDALRNYQGNKGITVSGSLDPLTYYALNNDDELADKHFIDFGSYSFYWHDAYASFGGAWDRMNDSEGYVVSSEVECDKGRRTCIETEGITARLLGLDVLNSKRIDFNITKWDEYELIAEDTSPDCERDELRVNRQEKTVLLTSTPTYKLDSCKKTLGKPETVTYRLVDGTKIFTARTATASKRRSSLYQFSSGARSIIEGN